MPGPAAQYPQRQRYIYSLKSFSLLNGVELFAGLTGFSADVTIEGADALYGTGMLPYGEPRGELHIAGELTFALEAFFDFVTAHPRILMERYDWTAVMMEGDRNDSIGMSTVRIMGFNPALEGTEASTITVPFKAYDLLINGQSVVEGDALGANTDAGAA